MVLSVSKSMVQKRGSSRRPGTSSFLKRCLSGDQGSKIPGECLILDRWEF
jgi:hypothetical protein